MFRRALYRGFSLIAEGKIRKFIAATARPRQAQLEKLLKIIRSNASSSFGREHKFSEISSIDDFRRIIPIRDYEGYRPYIERAVNGERNVLTADDPLMYATTSGTTGLPKYIPITPGYMEEFRLASVISGYHLLKTYPSIDRGVSLSVASPAVEGHTPGGTPYGAISGQLFQSEPYLIKKFISPIPYEVYLIKDYETRYYTLLRLAVSLPISFFYTLNPSTISLLCRRLKTHAVTLIKDVRDGTITPPQALDQKTFAALKKFLAASSERAERLQALLDQGSFVPEKIWPTLAVVSCWTKAAAAFYLSDFPEHFGEVPVSDITYGASEGRGSVFMGPGKEVLALQSHFFEFIAEDEVDRQQTIETQQPKTLLADELEEGKNYFILFTTSSGLYRYNINDVVKVKGFYNATPILEFQYKGGNVCSFTGEKITELQVTTAVKRAEKKTGTRLRFFTVVPRFRPEPHYEVWIEDDRASGGEGGGGGESGRGETSANESGGRGGSGRGETSAKGSGETSAKGSGDQASEQAPLAQAKLAQAIDGELCSENSEYKVKRESLRLSGITIRQLKPGSYERFRKYLTGQGVADAQIKVSHLNPKDAVCKFFENEMIDATSSATQSKSLSNI